MSEYQYYEFQTLDRHLTQAEKTEISKLSSRVKPTSTTTIFTYSYGDLPGNPQKILTQYFDVMYYIANWGTQQLMFRLPKTLIQRQLLDLYCFQDCLTISESADWLILDWQFHQEEGFSYWIEGDGILSQLIELRQEILQQDYRGCYLAWLKGITLSPEYVDISLDLLEPPVPPGLHELSPAQKAFCEIFELDKHLISAACATSSQIKTTSKETLQKAISQLPRSECDDLLLRLAQEEANLSSLLQQKLFKLTPKGNLDSNVRRTVKQLFDSAKRIEKVASQQQKQQAEAKRQQELETLAKRETEVWDEIKSLIQISHSKNYDRAVQLLVQLKDLAQHQNQSSVFQQRLNWISQNYTNRTGLMKRLNEANLTNI